MATLKLNSYELFTQSENNKPEFGAGVPAGCIIQVKEQIRTSHLDLVEADGYVDLVSVNITPVSSTSKFKISLQVSVSSDNNNNYSFVQLHRNGTSIAGGDAIGTSQAVWLDAGCKEADNMLFFQQKQIFGTYIDYPNTTSEITYTAKIKCDVNGTLFVGRTYSITDNHRSTTPTVFVVEELSG